MISQRVSIHIRDISTAPKWSSLVYPPTSVLLTDAFVIREGTKEGNPTIDLVLQDSKGATFVAMTSLCIMEGLLAAMIATLPAAPDPTPGVDIPLN